MSVQHADITRNLARFVVQTKWSAIPEDVRHKAKCALLNYFAVALSGSDSQPVEASLALLSQFSGGRSATIVGRKEKIDALNAAFLNAASGNVFDFCDTHLPTVIHPTAPVAPALFAFSELQNFSGEDLLLAFVLAVEVECRIGLAISPGHYTKGWHITSTCGVFGAATGVGKLLRLDEQQMIWALGNASAQSSGLCETLGWPAKSLSVGNAARNGLLSALLAKDGYAGPAEPLAGKQGFFNAMGEPVQWDWLRLGFGETWELRNNAIKPYPGGFVLHPFLDCVLDWRRAHPEETPERVVLRGNPLLSIRANRPDVSTGREAQVSVQHAVAAAFVRGRAGVEEFSDACVNDPVIVEMRKKINVVVDHSVKANAAKVEIRAASGRGYNLVTGAAKGSPDNPLTDSEIEDKLRVAAGDQFPTRNLNQLIESIWLLESVTDVASLMRLASIAVK